MTCVSAETAPNRWRNSSNVSATSESGTGEPSLNRSGIRISYRRCKVLIGGRAFDFERQVLAGQIGKNGFVQHQVAIVPALKGESTGQPTQRALLCFAV